ncbi:hypothetical protein [Nonomuraea rubra]
MLARIEENRARMADAQVPVAQMRAMITEGWINAPPPCPCPRPQ